jgi:DNA-binding FrmR family transcriptional regulator
MAKYGYHEHKDNVLARLNRIEGQVRGVRGMVEREEYCIDILTQIAAVNSALKKTAVLLLDDHIRHCVVESGDMVDEATAAIERLVRT